MRSVGFSILTFNQGVWSSNLQWVTNGCCCWHPVWNGFPDSWVLSGNLFVQQKKLQRLAHQLRYRYALGSCFGLERF